MKPGQTEVGRAEVREGCTKSETVPSNRTVITEQPHPTIAHWKRTPKSNLSTETRLRTKTWPVLGQNNPVSLSDSKSPRQQDQPAGNPGQARPSAPPSGLTSKWPFLIPVSRPCIRSLLLDAALWEMRGWETKKAILVWTPGKAGGRVGTHRGPLPCRLLYSGANLPLPPSSEHPLVPLIVPANATPHPGHSHTLPCSGRDTSSYPLAPAKGVQATLPCLLR